MIKINKLRIESLVIRLILLLFKLTFNGIIADLVV